ncbi:MAG: GHMP kinase [Kiritimatiellae bacterium]|nr:GHMP kinase [Kiritimatiellia bacterium]
MLIKTSACARAALIGNPSDGYFGKTISFAFTDFQASVTLWESPELTILPTSRDTLTFASMGDLAHEVNLFGYYGGVRLLKAAVKTFHEYVCKHGIRVDRRNFTVRCESTIPGLVGMAGSSAIITAAYRALMTFYGVSIPKPELANVIRSTEEKELGIAAGLQDRVIQVYGGLVYMDFDKTLLDSRGYGEYVPMDVSLMPPVFVAYRTDLSETSSVYHNTLKARYAAGDREVVDAMKFWADITEEARGCIERRDWKRLSELMDANFDRRAKVSAISPDNLRMVETARKCGCSAKFTGSGGAIVGIYPDDAAYARLEKALAEINVRVLRPHVAPPCA